MPPVIVGLGELGLEERLPTRFSRLCHQSHPGFFRGTVSLDPVAIDAAANYVRPHGLSLSVPQHDVIDRQVFPILPLPAVLAHMMVARENMRSRKSDFFHR